MNTNTNTNTNINTSKKKNAVITITMPLDLKKRIIERAEIEGRSLSSCIREILKKST